MADLQMYRGDTAPFVGAVTESNGDPRDITTDTLFFTAKHSIADPDLDAVIALETGSGIEATDPGNGIFVVTVPPASTSGLDITEETVLQYDVQLVDDSGGVFTIDRGTISIVPDVTRAIS